MERSEETLTTRDLAQSNEPADRGAVGDTAGEGAVYDQARVGREEPGEGIPAGERTGIGSEDGEQGGIGAEQADRAGAVRSAGGDAGTAAGADDVGAGAQDGGLG
ncbi:MAG: hypothetical protein JO304_26155, partial [Solirubrobacterales bacterium]|nr:hypothetical protein [Solirubrobacterales bacterium]